MIIFKIIYAVTMSEDDELNCDINCTARLNTISFVGSMEGGSMEGGSMLYLKQKL